MTQQKIGLLILRFGLASVFLWFGFSQLFDGANWVSWVPEWAVNTLSLPPAMIVLANGLFEVVFGTLLAMGILLRFVLPILALHFALITIEIGVTAVGVRDFGLTLATVALYFLSRPEEEEIIVVEL